MKVLVVGSGGREHALCWRIAKSDRLSGLYCAPGNAGISNIAECVDINSDDIGGLLRFASDNDIGLTVVGPEAPLASGIVDAFDKQGLKIFGPNKISAQLESSKIFAKEAMKRSGIKTADFQVFDNSSAAKKYIHSSQFPIVIKADGLCAGKGVVIAGTQEEALSVVDSMMREKDFGAAGERIIIEKCLEGEEASIMLISDGKDYVLLPASQDHKRIFDDDKGANTGGMGAYSPAPVITDQLTCRIEREIIKPFLNDLRREGTPYKGVLYIGLMIVDGEPHVLEFNVRFGDPEAQAVLPRVQTDLIDILEKAVDEDIKNIEAVFDKRPCVCVVVASGGYPGTYKKNIPIMGLERASSLEDIVVFHAGTKIKQTGRGETEIVTSGGRVLGVTAMAGDIKSTINMAYEAVGLIGFEDMHYRKDIGKKALAVSKF